MDQYIIVGRRIDEGDTRYLHTDGSIDKTPKDGSTALTVEFIGKKVIELSQNPPLERGSAAYTQVTEQIRNALVVKGPDNTIPKKAELDAILANVTVELEYDKRIASEGEADRNTRTLVIPVGETLAYRERYFENIEPNPGFKPPLTYALDRMMMKLYFSRLIKEVVGDFVDNTGAALPASLQDGLSKAVDEKLGSFDALAADAEDEIEKSKVRILKSPVSAFHRAVGIYITNMCD